MQVQSVLCGDIVALQGIKHSFSGDTLLDSKDDSNFQLEKITFPDPIYTASVEYNSVKDKTKVLEALQQMQKEDTSFQLIEDKESGQLLIQGLGELHLEVIRDRLELEFNLSIALGKMKVKYKESISNHQSLSLEYSKVINNKPNYFTLELLAENIEHDESLESFSYSNQIIIDFQRSRDFDSNFELYKKYRIENDKNNMI